MMFPRLNNLSFRLLPLAFIMLVGSIFVEEGAGPGWTLYPRYVAAWGIPDHLWIYLKVCIWWVAISSILGAINFISTIF